MASSRPKPAPPRRPRGPQHSPSMLKLLRQQTGLTWLEFARLVGAPKWLVVRWSKGSPIISVKHRERLAEIARGTRALPAVEPEQRRNLILGIIDACGTFPAPEAAAEPVGEPAAAGDE